MRRIAKFFSYRKISDSSEKGTVIAETAVAAPLLMLLFMGIWEYAYFLPVQQDLINIAGSAMRQSGAIPNLTPDVACVSDGVSLPSPCEADPSHIAVHDRVNQLLALHGYETLPFYELTSFRSSANDTVTFTVHVRIPTILSGLERTVSTSVTGPYLSNTGSGGGNTETDDTNTINNYENIDDKGDDTKWKEHGENECHGKWCGDPK